MWTNLLSLLVADIFVQACADNVAVIVPVLLVHLEPARDADVRLSFLALLETMLSNDAICKVGAAKCKTTIQHCSQSVSLA